jgi:hypothetical protein
MRVPMASLTHSSRPDVPSSAVKKSRPSTSTRSAGYEEPVGSMSATRTVPGSVPSLNHGSSPLSSSLATKNTPVGRGRMCET